MNEQHLPATHSELLTVAEEARARWQVPGLALGIMVDGATFSAGLGVNALDTGHAVRPDTLFQVGSISKPFAATLTMSLVDDHVLELDTPAIVYMPDLQLEDMRAAGAITPRQLLVHTGGFWGDWFADRGLGDDAVRRFVAEYGALHQLTAPGELWAYNNCGYILLGRLCEVLTGQTYERALRERVLAPLGLEHTFLFAHEAITYPLAVGHNQESNDAEVVIARQFLRPRARNAAGGVIASVEDIIRFGSFHLLGAQPGDDVLRETTRLYMQQPHVPSVAEGEFWGLGWRVTGEGRTRTFGHGGATNGFRASLTIAPENGFVLAVLTNSSRGSAAAHEITEWALRHYCRIDPAAPTFIDLPTEQLASLAGRYEQPYSAIEVEPQPVGILLRHFSDSPYDETNQPPPRIDRARPISDYEFVVTSGENKDSHLRFVYDAAGDVRFLQVGGRLYTPVSM